MLLRKHGKMSVNKNKMAPQTNCESCMYFDYDQTLDEQICTQALDEDEAEKRAFGIFTDCPYYKFYDEYKSVQKQN